MRLGLGYLNTWVGFMGFAIGYLPFVIFYKEHKAFLKDSVWVEKFYWPQLFTDSHYIQVIIAILFLIALIFFLFYIIKKGAKDTGTTKEAIINLNTEDLQYMIDKKTT